MSTWSSLFAEALGASAAPAPVERLSVRPGEVTARVGGHEVSLIRTLPSEADWERLCAALASQPVFRSRVLAGELPVAVSRVFSLLGVDLVPRGWDELVATCSCDRWEGKCAHLTAVATALGAEADRDPFALTRWLGRERRELVTQVRTLSAAATKGASGEKEAFGKNVITPTIEAGDSSPSSPSDTSAPATAAAFWSAPRLPVPPNPPAGSGERVRAAAPGLVADELPDFGHTST